MTKAKKITNGTQVEISKQAQVPFKTTLIIPGDRKMVYDRFKEIVPEVSGKLMGFIVEFVDRYEALQAQMTEQTVYEGKHDPVTDVFIGKGFSFYGVEIARGEDNHNVPCKIYLTKRGQFLVDREVVDNENVKNLKQEIVPTFAELSKMLKKRTLGQCSEYLSINNPLRTYELLDI